MRHLSIFQRSLRVATSSSSSLSSTTATISALLALTTITNTTGSTAKRHRCASAMMMMSSTTTTTAAAVAAATSSSSSSTKKGAVIFLHGLGDGSPNGWEVSLEQQLVRYNPNLSSENLVYIFPNAPILPISINGGATMPGWFDLYDWPIDLDAQDDDVNIIKSISSINDVITKCVTDYNFSSQQIIIGGFSQGGAIALLSAYHPRHGPKSNAVGGCINLSGWLPLRTKNDEWTESLSLAQKENIPLFWGHGQYDEIVLIEHQQAGIKHLIDKCGVNEDVIQVHQYPIGHSSDPNEMKAVAEFIDRILFNERDNKPSASTGTTGSTGSSLQIAKINEL